MSGMFYLLFTGPQAHLPDFGLHSALEYKRPTFKRIQPVYGTSRYRLFAAFVSYSLLETILRQQLPYVENYGQDTAYSLYAYHSSHKVPRVQDIVRIPNPLARCWFQSLNR